MRKLRYRAIVSIPVVTPVAKLKCESKQFTFRLSILINFVKYYIMPISFRSHCNVRLCVSKGDFKSWLSSLSPCASREQPVLAFIKFTES